MSLTCFFQYLEDDEVYSEKDVVEYFQDGFLFTGYSFSVDNHLISDKILPTWILIKAYDYLYLQK